ncbi:hypothetical protein WJX72_000665 [[Myrmecia] bisecta]|uniref:Small EDRK-rich factor-like N-terminal domain-containing protein n=1 Tax=[Myrmecia] bisecta TaxID=41462 RepID=A0AAW1PAI7_9CHLO
MIAGVVRLPRLFDGQILFNERGTVFSGKGSTGPASGSRVAVFHSGRMTRGNQREIDRARAAKRKDANSKVTAKDKDGLSAAARRERDAKALQEKLAKKAGQEAKDG